MGAFFGSLAAICIGISELFGRRVMNVSSPLTAALVLQAVAVLAGLASVPMVAGRFAMGDFSWGMLSGLGLAVGLAAYFAGLERSTATVMSPTVATLSSTIPYAWALFRGAEASGLAIAGAAIAIIGLALIAAGDDEVERLRAGLAWGVLSGLGYGFGISVLIEASEDAGAWPAVGQRLMAAVIIGVLALVLGQQMVPPAGARISGLAAGLLSGVTSVFVVIGLRIDAAPTVVMTSMFPLVSVAVGFVFFSDPVTRRQALGIALALAGIAAVVGA